MNVPPPPKEKQKCTLNRFGRCFSIISLMVSAPAMAQNVDFADDFSVDSISYSSGTFSNNIGVSTATVVLGGIRLEAMDTGDGSRRYIDLAKPSDSLEVSAVFDPATSLPGSSNAQLYVSGILYNDVGDLTSNSPSSNGDVIVGIDLIIDGQGGSAANACINRIDANDDFVGAGLFDGQNCVLLDSPPVLPGQMFTLGYSLDRATSTLTFSFNNVTQSVAIPTPFYQPRNLNNRIDIQHFNGAGQAVILLNSITTDDGKDDFAGITPVIDRYRPFYSLDGVDSTVALVDGRVRLTEYSLDDNNRSIQIQQNSNGDYIEALLEISSESDISH